MRFRKGTALALAAILFAGVLSGCAEEEEVSAGPSVSLQNDGREAKLVLGELELSEERTGVLQEIVRKYEADFSHTEVEVRSFDSPEKIEEALRAGEIDLAEIDSKEQPALVREGLLMDFYPYLEVWEEAATLSQAARSAAGSMGEKHAYLLPNDISQDILYYRSDWFEEYNEGREADQAWYRTWDQIGGRTEEEEGKWIPGAGELLGDRGGLAFAGKDRLVDYFDAMVWSAAAMSRIADSGAAYFAPGGEGKTVFSLERAALGADQFERVMKNAALEETLDWTQDQAIQAFQEGKAGMLLADRTAIPILEKTMPDGSWTAEAFPRGLSGTAVVSPKSFSGWGISSKAEEQGIAVHFLMFLSNADNNTHYAAVCGTLPIHLEAADMEETLEEGPLAAELNMADHANWYQYASPPVMYQAYPGCRKETEKKLREFLDGTVSRDELLRFLDGSWSAAYSSEGNLWS